MSEKARFEGMLVLSWGAYGGFYLMRNRVCLGWVALTYEPYELDWLMEKALDRHRAPRPKESHR